MMRKEAIAALVLAYLRHAHDIRVRPQGAQIIVLAWQQGALSVRDIANRIESSKHRVSQEIVHLRNTFGESMVPPVPSHLRAGQVHKLHSELTGHVKRALVWAQEEEK